MLWRHFYEGSRRRHRIRGHCRILPVLLCARSLAECYRGVPCRSTGNELFWRDTVTLGGKAQKLRDPSRQSNQEGLDLLSGVMSCSDACLIAPVKPRQTACSDRN